MCVLTRARTILEGSDLEAAKSPMTPIVRSFLVAIHSVDAAHQHNRFYQSYKAPHKKDVGLEKSLRPIRMVLRSLPRAGGSFGASRASTQCILVRPRAWAGTAARRPYHCRRKLSQQRRPPRLTPARSPKTAGLLLCVPCTSDSFEMEFHYPAIRFTDLLRRRLGHDAWLSTDPMDGVHAGR